MSQRPVFVPPLLKTGKQFQVSGDRARPASSGLWRSPAVVPVTQHDFADRNQGIETPNLTQFQRDFLPGLEGCKEQLDQLTKRCDQVFAPPEAFEIKV